MTRGSAWRGGNTWCGKRGCVAKGGTHGKRASRSMHVRERESVNEKEKRNEMNQHAPHIEWTKSMALPQVVICQPPPVRAAQAMGAPWVRWVSAEGSERIPLIHLQRTHTRMRHIAWRRGGPIGRRSGRSNRQQRKDASDQECWAEIWQAANCAPAARTRQGTTEKPPKPPNKPKRGHM